MMAIKSYLMDKIYNLKTQKQILQNATNVETYTEQVNNGLVEEPKIKFNFLENENKHKRKAG